MSQFIPDITQSGTGQRPAIIPRAESGSQASNFETYLNNDNSGLVDAEPVDTLRNNGQESVSVQTGADQRTVNPTGFDLSLSILPETIAQSLDETSDADVSFLDEAAFQSALPVPVTGSQVEQTAVPLLSGGGVSTGLSGGLALSDIPQQAANTLTSQLTAGADRLDAAAATSTQGLENVTRSLNNDVTPQTNGQSVTGNASFNATLTQANAAQTALPQITNLLVNGQTVTGNTSFDASLTQTNAAQTALPQIAPSQTNGQTTTGNPSFDTGFTQTTDPLGVQGAGDANANQSQGQQSGQSSGQSAAQQLASLLGNASSDNESALPQGSGILASSASQLQSTSTPLQQSGNPALQFSANASTSETISDFAAQLSRNTAGGRDSFNIRLNPSELGRVDVRLITNEDGSVNARIQVERSETLDLFQRDARALERTLQQSGLKLSSEGVEVSLKDNGEGSNQSAFGSDLQDQQNDNGSNNDDKVADQLIDNALLVDDVDTNLTPELVQTIYARYQPGQLNIRV